MEIRSTQVDTIESSFDEVAKSTTTWEMSPKQLTKFLIDKGFLESGTEISFITSREPVSSKYDDPRDPPNYKTVVKKIIFKHEH